ncbi:hypothetical protein ABZY93_22285 [Streptomyces smyrnaeus]|uniref:hypothetical protein n=1 Tax=Streptomyces smyrnaeus TaxID=1387713 RepID=UPI0033B5F8B1
MAIVTLRVDTSRLKVGDVVLEHGMRVKLDQEPRVYEGAGHEGRTVYAFDGLVENIDEVREQELVPIHFLYPDVFRGGWCKDWDAEPRWTVQGNDLATWVIERDNACPYTFAHTNRWCGYEGCRES